LDLSPYFLSIAKYRSKENEKYSKITWTHAAAENTPWEENSFDFISLVGTTHEIPASVMPTLLQEIYRLLKAGGNVAIIDVDAENIKKMPGFIYALFKSTEPDMDDFLTLNLPKSLSATGFTNIKEDKTSINRRVLTVATKPAQ